jgi:hypothetical protein
MKPFRSTCVLHGAEEIQQDQDGAVSDATRRGPLNTNCSRYHVRYVPKRKVYVVIDWSIVICRVIGQEAKRKMHKERLFGFITGIFRVLVPVTFDFASARTIHLHNTTPVTGCLSHNNRHEELQILADSFDGSNGVQNLLFSSNNTSLPLCTGAKPGEARSDQRGWRLAFFIHSLTDAK